MNHDIKLQLTVKMCGQEVHKTVNKWNAIFFI